MILPPHPEFGEAQQAAALRLAAAVSQRNRNVVCFVCDKNNDCAPIPELEFYSSREESMELQGQAARFVETPLAIYTTRIVK